ncbi:MAG: tRNA guanosine(34) transglycosylase Tgt [Candidatus Peregrinibacteria bacterium]|nr:tRNA guanosine(34) transglycosylase Tgt [Candidatus Peregrinibacteria bacterium]
MTNFELKKTDGGARLGVLKTRRGEICTPVFMPPATRAAIKAGVSSDDLRGVGAQVILGNTYHLFLRPGAELIKEAGGLHDFMKWDRPILTDSGGFQVFSIERKKIKDHGVYFNSHIDGARFFMDAKVSIETQLNLGSDILMVFDECPPSQLQINDEQLAIDKEEYLKRLNRKLYFKVLKAVERTTDWAKRSLDVFKKSYDLELPVIERPQIFGIIQGGCFDDLRNKSLSEITAMDFDGFALGGLAVGESADKMYEVLDEMAPKMPVDKPRYLMGVGTPENILEAVERGVDMFDCVMPMRNARHGDVITAKGSFKIENVKFRDDKKVLDEDCGCEVCLEKKYSRAYIHHLFRVGEDLGRRLATIHNLYFYHEMMRNIREQISAGTFQNWKKRFLKKFNS